MVGTSGCRDLSETLFFPPMQKRGVALPKEPLDVSILLQTHARTDLFPVSTPHTTTSLRVGQVSGGIAVARSRNGLWEKTRILHNPSIRCRLPVVGTTLRRRRGPETIARESGSVQHDVIETKLTSKSMSGLPTGKVEVEKALCDSRLSEGIPSPHHHGRVLEDRFSSP